MKDFFVFKASFKEHPTQLQLCGCAFSHKQMLEGFRGKIGIEKLLNTHPERSFVSTELMRALRRFVFHALDLMILVSSQTDSLPIHIICSTSLLSLPSTQSPVASTYLWKASADYRCSVVTSKAERREYILISGFAVQANGLYMALERFGISLFDFQILF